VQLRSLRPGKRPNQSAAAIGRVVVTGAGIVGAKARRRRHPRRIDRGSDWVQLFHMRSCQYTLLVLRPRARRQCAVFRHFSDGQDRFFRLWVQNRNTVSQGERLRAASGCAFSRIALILIKRAVIECCSAMAAASDRNVSSQARVGSADLPAADTGTAALVIAWGMIDLKPGRFGAQHAPNRPKRPEDAVATRPRPETAARLSAE